jgi:YgiT-type zinc finger domain-containing protein
MSANISDLNLSCAECQAGQMHRQFITYFTWLGDELITVPNFPAWVCDVCGKRDYDTHAVNRLNLLLNPNAGRPSLHKPRISPPSTLKGTRPTTE